MIRIAVYNFCLLNKVKFVIDFMQISVACSSMYVIINNVFTSRNECLSFIETRLARDSTNSRVSKVQLILVSCINRVSLHWIYHCCYVDFHLLSQEINYSPSTKLWQPLHNEM